MNLAAAAFNFACAIAWAIRGESFFAVVSILGGYLCVTAYKWARL